MKRGDLLATARAHRQPYDFVVIGGGATGAGVALDAATRGFEVLLVEARDFSSGTSSRSTKLVHGGVRYLAQGRIGLVREALYERARMHENAPHLVSVLPILVPAATWFGLARFWIGLKIYDWLSGKASFGRSRFLSSGQLRERMPEVANAGLRGAVEYFDGQFDDARYVIDLVRTAAAHGATPLNYCRVTALAAGSDGRLAGATICDALSGETFEVAGRVVINATGPYSDSIRSLDDPKSQARITPSQGVHLVVDRHFLPGDDGLLIPKTPDGRIMFALPWHDHVMLGTTDTLLEQTPREPVAQDAEIRLILETAARYLTPAPQEADILAVYAGVRPLPRIGKRATAKLSRKHSITVSRSGLITIAGGKWTTYRKMAEDCVDRAIVETGLAFVPCRTASLRLKGAGTGDSDTDRPDDHGIDAACIRALVEQDPRLAETLHPDLPYIAAQCVWAVREEMALTIEDVLARRTRALFLNASAALECAPRVAGLMASEMGWDQATRERELADFRAAAVSYGGRPPGSDGGIFEVEVDDERA
jgi:glycerol-3-phosphate dehydrogenase